MDLKELQSIHGKMHEAVKRVCEFKKTGKIADAEKALAEVKKLSVEVVNLLTKIEVRAVLV